MPFPTNSGSSVSLRSLMTARLTLSEVKDLDLRRHRGGVDDVIAVGLLLLLKAGTFREFITIRATAGARRGGQQIQNPKRHSAGDDDKKKGSWRRTISVKDLTASAELDASCAGSA